MLGESTGAFLRPDRHTLPSGLQSLSGSDQNGGCASTTEMILDCMMNDVCECSGNVQTTSALIDGVYPIGVIDTSGTNWASDFFTVNRNGDSVSIGFQWDSGFELRGVELKLFNCLSEGIPEGDSNTGIYIAEVRFSDTTITVPTEVSSTLPLPPASSTSLPMISMALLSSQSSQLSSSSLYTFSATGELKPIATSR